MKDYDWTEEKKPYTIRVRITYEDVVKVKAHDLRSAKIKAEKYVFDNMNDGVESTTETWDWSEVYLSQSHRRDQNEV